jgi:hypothetical protein
MASKLYDLKLACFTSAGNPATGAGLLGQKAVELWDDGTILFTDAASNRRKIHDSFELNALLDEIAKGASGVSTVKRFHK